MEDAKIFTPMEVGIHNNKSMDVEKIVENMTMEVEPIAQNKIIIEPVTGSVYNKSTADNIPQSDLVPIQSRNKTTKGLLVPTESNKTTNDHLVPKESKNKTAKAGTGVLDKDKKKTKMMFNGQGRELIMRLRTYFERECQNGGPLLPVQQVVDRVSDALGVSRKTIARITTQKFGKDRMQDNNLLDWKPTKVVPKRVSGADDIKARVIRNHIYDYYRRMEVPSLSKLVKSLSSLDIYKGGETSLRRLMKSIGFEYVPIPRRKKILMEETNQAFVKCSIPKDFIDIRQWKNVMVLEESSFRQDGLKEKYPFVNIPKEKMIICHAVNTLCMPKYCLAFPIHDMDATKFRDWFLKLLYPYPA